MMTFLIDGVARDLGALVPPEGRRQGWSVANLEFATTVDGVETWKVGIWGPIGLHVDVMHSLNAPDRDRLRIVGDWVGFLEAPTPERLVRLVEQWSAAMWPPKV